LVFAGSGRGKKIREVRSGKEGERRDAVKRAGRYRALVQEAVLGRVVCARWGHAPPGAAWIPAQVPHPAE
jgi:hypothetical protein